VGLDEVAGSYVATACQALWVGDFSSSFSVVQSPHRSRLPQERQWMSRLDPWLARCGDPFVLRQLLSVPALWPDTLCGMRPEALGQACVSGPIFMTVSFWKPSLPSGTPTRSNTLDLSWLA
jgi:hypothetical protein